MCRGDIFIYFTCFGQLNFTLVSDGDIDAGQLGCVKNCRE